MTKKVVVGKKVTLINKQILDNYLHGVLTEDQVREVEVWLVNHEEEKEVNAFLSSVWTQSSFVKLNAEDREQILDRLKELIQKDQKNGHLHYFTVLRKIAAILILPILVLSVYFFMHSREAKPQIFTVNTTAGEQKEVLLPDGSHVILNNQTTLTYQYDPKINERLVALTGEACFTVKKSTVPFIVDAKEIKVRVLGTIFNVRAYYDDASIRVSLKRGSVRLTENGNTVSYKMVPGQNAVFNKPSKTLQVRTEDITQNFDWMSGTLVFDDEPLTQVAKEIERKYGVKISLASASLKSDKCCFTATLRNENLDEVLEAINLITPIHYEKKGTLVIIRETKNNH